MLRHCPSQLRGLRFTWNRAGVAVSLMAVLIHLVLRYGLHAAYADLPLWVAVIGCGVPLLFVLSRQIVRGRFGSDFLAGLSIVTATIVGELLVATIIILMYAGGQALEEYATQRASSVLNALAKRMPTIAHRVIDGARHDITASEIAIGDHLVIFPHEICPVDGTVVSGTGTMDESFLTGEPFRVRKISGSQVLSGAINQDSALTIVADKLAVDSRYARIVQVMQAAEKDPPHIRRLADRLGAFYTPIAVALALAGWAISGNAERFLAVIVIATPCPLLLAIPVSIIGAISLAAKRGIVIKKPAVLEQVGQVQTMFFDKTGTLTHGEPVLTEILCFGAAQKEEVLRLAASVEQYSKHPLAKAILRAAGEEHLALAEAQNISERPGQGLVASVGGRSILVTGRRQLAPEMAATLPPSTSGMECILVISGILAALLRFHDRPRKESKYFIRHLQPKHHVVHLTILSGDRDREVQHLADIVGIGDVRAALSPEQKLAIVRAETARSTTMFVGDGINDAPAMMAATVGVAFGQNSDITAEAAGAVILQPTLGSIDELLHIGRRMRHIAVESAVGGMVLSSVGMIAAVLGYLPPLAGAIGQEAIDLVAVLNAIRASQPAKAMRDF